MRILLDQGTPIPLRYSVAGHDIHTVHEFDWTYLSDYELLLAAEREGFEALISTDIHLSDHHDLSQNQICVVVLSTARWKLIRLALGDVDAALLNVRPGTYINVTIPDLPHSDHFAS